MAGCGRAMHSRDSRLGTRKGELVYGVNALTSTGAKLTLIRSAAPAPAPGLAGSAFALLNVLPVPVLMLLPCSATFCVRMVASISTIPAL